MGSLPCACYFGGTNSCATRVHETSLLHIWPPRFSYDIKIAKQICHIAILTAIAKGPFGKAK
jgi:hypothetical protein